jgi:ribonuclease HI
MKETITIQFDGGSRGNPGLAGVGVVLSAEDGTKLVTRGRYIGNATNNVAEYMALILGLREAAALGAGKILVRGDSELVIKQMRGEYRVKNPGLRELYEQARTLADQFESVKFEHNLRHHNSLADRLANLAMTRRANVDEVDEDIESPEPGENMRRISCEVCGCEIEIIKLPKKAKPDSKFICRCGNPME